MSKAKKIRRGSGILLHISSLPSKYGIGSFGAEAYEFVDFLRNSAQRYWQILPLSPVGAGNSPYQSYSAFAINPYFVDLEALQKQGLLSQDELKTAEVPMTAHVNYAQIHRVREALTRKAFDRFDPKDADFVRFCANDTYRDYALFMTLKEMYKGQSFLHWKHEHKFRSLDAMQKVLHQKKSELNFYLWQQFTLKTQWHKLKAYANSRGISIIGDMPIYLDLDSVECWQNPRLLKLDEELKPTAVAGVPPDYFSSTGQLWGNPLYDWDYHRQTDYKWWKKRIYQAANIYDFVRIDHFRGFYEYYSIPHDAQTAKEGHWCKGCGTELFDSLLKRTKKQLIAEDLGCLDDGAVDFFKKLGFPGMKVLQFAFDGSQENPHLPKNFGANSVVYTGTHDNDTLKGFLHSVPNKPELKKRIKAIARELSIKDSPKNNDEYIALLIKIALYSDADFCIIPMQDILGKGSSSRMNTPSTVSKQNWSYRMDRIPHELFLHLLSLVTSSGRL